MLLPIYGEVEMTDLVNNDGNKPADDGANRSESLVNALAADGAIDTTSNPPAETAVAPAAGQGEENDVVKKIRQERKDAEARAKVAEKKVADFEALLSSFLNGGKPAGENKATEADALGAATKAARLSSLKTQVALAPGEADAAKLLDSASFNAKLESLEEDADLSTVIKDFVAANPWYKAVAADTPRAGNLGGGQAGVEGTRSDELRDALRKDGF